MNDLSLIREYDFAMEIEKRSPAEEINSSCICKTLDESLLDTLLKKELGEDILATRPNLFSSTLVFLSPEQLSKIQLVIQTIEEVIKSPDYQNIIIKKAPSIASYDPGPEGAFMGYDFHLDDDGPKLIEINTNAGGALLNTKLAYAQRACCSEVEIDKEIEKKFVEMFLNEFALQKGDKPLRTIAIVDENPEAQYLYPEFKLFQKLFTANGINAVIASPEELKWKDDRLYFQDTEIDLIYNRLTDFYLEAPSSLTVKIAFESGNVVVTPNPHHHALYANKMNLTLLSQKSELEKLGLSPDKQSVLLSGIPHTESVNVSKSDDLWSRRKDLFFKPTSGFGSKATYRGDKITKKVWSELIVGDYVAQALISPSERIIEVDNETKNLKVDIRAYVYKGEIQLLAARLYSGQTTNFRTNGGGFAPVFMARL